MLSNPLSRSTRYRICLTCFDTSQSITLRFHVTQIIGMLVSYLCKGMFLWLLYHAQDHVLHGKHWHLSLFTGKLRTDICLAVYMTGIFVKVTEKLLRDTQWTDKWGKGAATDASLAVFPREWAYPVHHFNCQHHYKQTEFRWPLLAYQTGGPAAIYHCKDPQPMAEYSPCAVSESNTPTRQEATEVNTW